MNDNSLLIRIERERASNKDGGYRATSGVYQHHNTN